MTTVPLNTVTGPYTRGAQVYLDRGWVAPLPCDHRLGRVPTGFTGYTTAVPTAADITMWITSRGDANLGLRMQEGTLGIDVDCHDGKRGCEILELAEQMNGVLPRTWYSTSRSDGSRHLLFRVPKGMEWKSEIVVKSLVDDKGKPVKGIEILRPHHRWARAWPSLNPNTGQPIHWYTPDGVVSAVPPRPEDLAELPAEWVEYLRGKAQGDKGTLEFTDEKFDWSQFTDEPDSIPPGDQNNLLFQALSSARAGSRDALTYLAVQLVKQFQEQPGHDKGEWDAKSINGVVEQVVKFDVGPSVGVVAPELKRWAQQVDAGMLDGWLDVTELDRLVAPSYLVKGLLDRPVVALLHGDGGVGKSFMSLDIAAHVALGRQWRGQRVRQTRVAYVYAESPSFASRRVAAWCHVNETPLEELKGKLVVYPKALDLLGASEPLEALASWLEKAGVGLIVVDTLRRNMAGGDENSQKDTSRALAWGTRFTQSNATCLVIHHDNKGGSYSGSTAMHGHVDTRLHLTRDERDSTVMRLEADKQREMADNGALFGRLESIQLGIDDDGDPIYSAAFVEADEPEKLAENDLIKRVKANQDTLRVVTIVEEMGPIGINQTLREWVARHGKVGKMTVQNALNCALEDGSITRNDAKQYLRFSGQTAG